MLQGRLLDEAREFAEREMTDKDILMVSSFLGCVQISFGWLLPSTLSNTACVSSVL